MTRVTLIFCIVIAAAIGPEPAQADPCGMVPPVYTGPGDPIERVGAQKTFVFYKRGIETFVIRPGFRGKVEQFGMLIPFPTPPAIRKVPDTIFSQIAAAIDPPEIVVYANRWGNRGMLGGMGSGARVKRKSGKGGLEIRKNQVRVLREEAVGMYEVAVLQAGSPAALKRWMENHGYKYPKGMDAACNDYVKLRWCFVAVKTRVGQKKKVDPRPGLRKAKTGLPAGGSFSGHVQGMGFRFKTDGLVVPMRLSAFNKGRLRNVVYILTNGPKRINKIPERVVMRQIPGWKLYRNLTRPLPLRVIGGTFKDISKWQRKNLSKRRDPTPFNGQAAELFSSDILAARKRKLSHPFEEREKVLLNIGERLGLRGPAIDKLNAKVIAKSRNRAVNRVLSQLKKLTMTVVDGDFPRDVIAKDNLRFAWYRMPRERNTPARYNARTLGPGSVRRDGVLYRGALPKKPSEMRYARSFAGRHAPLVLSVATSFLVLFGGVWFYRRRRR